MAFDLSSYLVPLNPLMKDECGEPKNGVEGSCSKLWSSNIDPLVEEINQLSFQKQPLFHRRRIGVVDPPPAYALDLRGRDVEPPTTDPLYAAPNDPHRSSYLRNLDLSFIEGENNIWQTSSKLSRSSSFEAKPSAKFNSFSSYRSSSPPPTSNGRGIGESYSDSCFSTSDSYESGPFSPPRSPASPEDLSDDTSDASSCKERRRKKGPRKRKVSFPDEVGLPLTTVRLVEEYVPRPIVHNTRRNARPADYNCRRELILGFVQPVFDLDAFLRKVNTNFVSLENIRTDGDEFLGTIRVKNIAFEKKVIVRYTINNWASSRDVMTSYVVPQELNQSHVPYDTFSFRISVASTTAGVEFAICYWAGDAQYWDNNDGINYHLYCVTKEPTYVDDEDEDDGDVEPDEDMDYSTNDNDEDDAFFDF